MSDPTHTFHGPHPEVLGDGTPLAAGSTVTPNLEDPHDRHLVDRGWLTEGVAHEATESPKASRRRTLEG
jgi:hypothetical protein